MAFEVGGRYPNKTPKIDGQRTFVLAFSNAVINHIVGDMVIKFEENNLKVEDMRLMGVRRKFIETHLSKPGRTPILLDFPNFDWVKYSIFKPVVVMILSGNDAINITSELVSGKGLDPLRDKWIINFYCSDSAENVEDDIKMWFNDYCADWSQTDLFHAFVNGKFHGSKDIFNDSVKDLHSYDIYPDLTDNVFWKVHVFVLISSTAVRNYKVGQIISGLELHCVSITGMKLVKKAEYSDNKVWAEIDENEFGIVVLMDMLNRDSIKELDEVDGLVHVDMESGCMLLKRNLVYISNKGAEAHQLAAEFFKFGAVSWVERENEEVNVFGGYFESTLIGLIE